MKPSTISIQHSRMFDNVAVSMDYFILSYNEVGGNVGRLHYHTSYEIELLLEGDIEMHINSNKFICTPGHCYIVLPDNFHRCFPLQERAKLVCMKFTEKALTKEALSNIKKNYPYYVRKTTSEELEFIKSEIDSLIVKLGNANTETFKQTLIKCALSQIVCKLFDNPQSTASQDNTVFQKKLIESVDYVKLHFKEKLSRDDIASKFGFSPAYYSTLFKKYTGKGFSDFVLGEKLNHAYYLLISTDSPIGVMAENAGFESFSYFSKAFKKAYGQSPSKVRESRDVFLDI